MNIDYIPTTVIDGETYSLSDDEQHITGLHHRFSVSEFKEQRISNLPFLVVPPDSMGPGRVFGFSDEAKLERWLKNVDLYEDYGKNREMLEAGKRRLAALTPEQRERHSRDERARVERATRTFLAFLEEHGVEPHEIDKIRTIRAGLGPEHDGDTLYLYENIWYGGLMVGLPSDLASRGGRYYDDLGNYQMDNKVSSYSLWGSWVANFWTEKFFGGQQIVAWGSSADLRWHGLDNVFSSAWVGDWA